MGNCTFLSYDQTYGDNKLDIFNHYTTKCTPTDFAILLGNAGDWYLKDGDIIDSNGDFLHSTNVNVNNIGARPVLSYDSIQDQTLYLGGLKDECGMKCESDIKEILFGLYPQTIVNGKCSNEFENHYQRRIFLDNNIPECAVLEPSIFATNRRYSTRYLNTNFGQGTFTEYEYREGGYMSYQNQLIDANFKGNVFYQNLKYIRVLGDANSEGKVLSNGQVIRSGYAYWIRVEPITWLIDEKRSIIFSKNILFSGVPFRYINQFIDNFFLKEIISSQEDLICMVAKLIENNLKYVKIKSDEKYVLERARRSFKTRLKR